MPIGVVVVCRLLISCTGVPARRAQPAASGPPGSQIARPSTNAAESPTAAARAAVVGYSAVRTRTHTAAITVATQMTSIASIHDWRTSLPVPMPWITASGQHA